MPPLANIWIVAVMTVYAAVSVFGLALLKQATDVISVKFMIGAAAYGAGFLIWILVIIRALPLSIAFPVSAGALIVGTQIAGYVFLRESITMPHIVGVVLIFAGILLISAGAGK